MAELRGLGAAPGTAEGRAHVVHAADETLRVPPGSILVMRIMHPHLAPVFAGIAGVVVEEGALLQHATTLAREWGVPAVVGVRGATGIVREGDRLEISGDTGLVIHTPSSPDASPGSSPPGAASP